MNNTSDERCNFEEMVTKLDAVLFMFIAAFALAGNGLVLVCYFKHKFLRSITNVFILGLSLSDLLVVSLSIPSFSLIYCGIPIIMQHSYQARLVYLACDILPSVLSIHSVTLIAVDKAMKIACPFLHHRYANRQRARACVSVTWIFAILMVSTVFVMDELTFTVFIVTLSYICPVVLMIVSYTIIGYIAKRHAIKLNTLDKTAKRLRKESVDVNKSFLQATSDCSNNLDSLTRSGSNSGRSSSSKSLLVLSVGKPSRLRINNGSVRSARREIKSAMTLSLLLGCCVLSWTPFMSLNFKYFTCPTCSISPDLIKYFKALHYSSSAANPILFAALNKQWRMAFRKTLCIIKK